MELHISASSIKDFLQCKRLLWYRNHVNYEKIISDEQALGIVVHSAIENCETLETMVNFVINEKTTYRFDVKKALICVSNYLYLIDPLLSHENFEKEYSYKVKYNRNYFLVGKFDRVEFSDSSVRIYDWKTSTEEANFFDFNSPQFYFYGISVALLFPLKSISLVYGDLYRGSLHTLDISNELWYNMGDDINVYREFSRKFGNNKFAHPRHISQQCASCPFKITCENDNECDN